MLAELSLLARYTVTADDTVYAIPFRVYRAEDVAVTFSTNGRTETSLTLGKDYSVQILPEGGAELTLAAGVAGALVPAGAVLAIASAVPATQEADFSNTATVNTGALETQLDREVQMIQQLKDGLALAVKVPAAGNESPEELLEDIFTARDTAVDSASSAQASANAAGNSAQSAAGSAAVATEQREAACICAGEAQDARDVALAQAEAANILMEAELSKINAIVAANKTDQQAAVTAAREWAEKAPDTPVDYDDEGNPLYSARHWAENAQKIAIEPPTAERRGAIRVGAGLHLTAGENGEADVLALDAVEELWLTESGTFEAPRTGWYDVLLIGGGDGGFTAPQGNMMKVTGGASGWYLRKFIYLTAGETIDVVIGTGGPGIYNYSGSTAGSDTIFGEYSTADAGSFRYPSSSDASTIRVSCPGSGPGGGESWEAGQFYGGGGGAHWVEVTGGMAHAEYNGAPGAVRLRWRDPAKAPAPQPALFSARRMAARASSAPATVNLYDPEIGQGSVWREEDADAKLAEGLISEEAWLEICAARAAEEREVWLANPETVAERFALLRAARDARLAATDYLVAPDYPLTDDQRTAVTAYRQALRDLPAQEGAPWDGGGELTPWPEAPATGNAQE